MDLSERVLGRHAAHILGERIAAPVLTIGTDRFTRADLAGVACFNFLAALRLSTLFHDLGVANTKDVFDRLPPSALAVPTIGAISLAVLGAAFQARRLGGEHPLEAWMIRHAANKEHPIVTFGAIKHRESSDPKRKGKARIDDAELYRRIHKRKGSRRLPRVRGVTNGGET